MKAAILHKPHTRVSVEDVDIESPHEGEVLLDIVGAGVCHSDYHYVDGHVKPRGLPLVMGHEGAGVVREVGPGVTSVQVGDKIVLSLDAMCGYCRNCSEGSPALCETHQGGCAESDFQKWDGLFPRAAHLYRAVGCIGGCVCEGAR